MIIGKPGISFTGRNYLRWRHVEMIIYIFVWVQLLIDVLNSTAVN